jgi:hypothetical protein
MIPAGEFAAASRRVDAEGATAPETLRHQDRAGAGTLESDDVRPGVVHRRA